MSENPKEDLVRILERYDFSRHKTINGEEVDRGEGRGFGNNISYLDTNIKFAVMSGSQGNYKNVETCLRTAEECYKNLERDYETIDFRGLEAYRRQEQVIDLMFETRDKLEALKPHLQTFTEYCRTAIKEESEITEDSPGYKEIIEITKIITNPNRSRIYRDRLIGLKSELKPSSLSQ